MKGLFIAALLVLIGAGFFLGASDVVAPYIDKYAIDNMKEPDIMEAKLFNIKYLEFTGKYDAALILVDKFMERYEDSSDPDASSGLYFKGKIYDGKMMTGYAKDFYNQYIQAHPDGKYAEKAKTRLKELL